ncbi:MAG: glycosyltransferase family 9 protein [Bacteroidetes bacterium]|nr:glycosyltransferase family 9 protein [Bacteroidota bacterium]
MNEPLLHAFSTGIGALYGWRSLRNVRRILIYKLDHMGDVLLATPALRAIRRRFPEAEIRIVVGEWSQTVLQNNPNVDEIVIYNSREFARYPYAAHKFSDLRQKLGSWKPDLVIGLRDDWRTVTDRLLSGARRINRGRVHFREWLERKRTNQPHSHEVKRLWAILRPLGIEPEPVEKLEYWVTDEERKQAAEFMLAHGIEGPFAIVHAGTSVPLKEWPLDKLAEASRHIASAYGMQVVLIGAPEEVDRSADLVSLIRDLSPVDISGKLNLRGTAALMERASLYLSSDGGAMHVASALGVPTVGLFGPGSYHIFRPVGRHATAISHLFPCSPCTMITCIRPNDTCMQAISAEEVILETDRLLARVHTAPANHSVLQHQSPR